MDNIYVFIYMIFSSLFFYNMIIIVIGERQLLHVSNFTYGLVMFIYSLVINLAELEPVIQINWEFYTVL